MDFQTWVGSDMSIDGRHDIDALKIIGAIVAEARDVMGAHVAPGVTTGELDDIGKKILDRHGARSAPQLAYGFPGTTCISVNDDIAHGIPPSNKVEIRRLSGRERTRLHDALSAVAYLDELRWDLLY